MGAKAPLFFCFLVDCNQVVANKPVMKTIDYYNQHADKFIASTFHIEMGELYQSFICYLPDSGSILDIGCGSGRDTLAFKNMGYQVSATDYSKELVEKARCLTGIDVRFESFYELSELNQYDGIWACAICL